MKSKQDTPRPSSLRPASKTFVLALCLSASASLLSPASGHARGPANCLGTCEAGARSSGRLMGGIRLDVDATDTRHGIIKTHEVVAVKAAGDLVLLYPQWETASHAPTVPTASMAGLFISVDGRRVEWRRDPSDVHAFHVTVPRGARAVEIDLQYIADRGTMRADRVSVPWHRALIYPGGLPSAAIPITASLRLPAGLTAFSSLDRVGADPAVLRFATTSLDRLVDAPVFAARHARTIPLSDAGQPPISLDLLADDPAALEVSTVEAARMRALVGQTSRVFGRPPFRRYRAIVTLDDEAGPGGAEHLEEGEINLPARYFVDPDRQIGNRDLIAHEFVHSWNGRFRQPSDLWTPTFNQPVGGSLLWVYEGQTEFWGRVLAARAGLRTGQQSLDRLAIDAAVVATRPGRAWKSLADSTNDAVYMAGHHVAWRDWQRREDYYPEGVLVWLDVEARLRELSGGRRGLDDFASRFFRVERPAGPVSTYTFDDVCRALDQVAHDDWRGFLQRHLTSHEDVDAMAGLARSGWRLVYATQPTEAFLQDEAETGGSDLTYSIGAAIDDDGRIISVAWGGAAFDAGLMPGMRVTRVASAPFSRAALLLAVSRTPQEPVALTVGTAANQTRFPIDYRGGLGYPRLERIPGTADRLMPLLEPRRSDLAARHASRPPDARRVRLLSPASSPRERRS
jgi:predicted metalloprotease with PDZ domain